MRRKRLCPTLALLGGAAALVAACGGSSTYTLVRDGNHAYAQGDSAKALDDYRQAQVQQPGLPLLNYDAGNALYQQGDYTRGITESKLATQNGDDALRAQAFYTIGADDYRQGKLQDALDAFKNALRIDPSDTDAKYNVELIQRQLDREAAARAGLPTPTPEPTQPPGQQGQQGQQGQGASGGAQNPPSAGQSNANAPTPPSNGQQNPNGQPNASGGQQGQQSGQSGQQNSGGQQSQGSSGQQGGQPSGSQSGQSFGGSAGANGPGTTGTPAPTLRQQQQQAAQALQQAISNYQQNGSIDDALGILDALAQQQAIQQQAQANRSDPHSLDK